MDELFEFTLPDGTKRLLTLPQARGFGDKDMNRRVDDILDSIKTKQKKIHKKDGFVPGWQENIRMYITCPHQYRRALRDLGLVELGNDYADKIKDTTTVSNPFANENFMREAAKIADLSGREIDALASGEYFKNTQKAILDE